MMPAGLSDIPVAEVEAMYYVWWPLATIVTILLMSFISFLGTVIVVFVKRLLTKFEELVDSVNNIKVDNAKVKTELHDHIGNEGMHCKGIDCMIHKRVTDA